MREDLPMARGVIAAVIVTYLLVVVQTTLGGRMAVSGVAPDLSFVWTVCVGLLSGPAAGAAVGFGAGLLEGSLQQSWIAAFSISKMMAGWGAGLLATKMFRENWLVPVLCAGLLTVANEAIFLVIARAGGWPEAGRIVGIRVIYHAAVAPFAFAAVGRARRGLMGQQREAA